MDWMQLLRMIFALAIVLGLIFMLAYVLKRYAPQLMAQLQAKRGEKRLQVVETLVLDPARRLVLVRLDNEERLILLGEGHELLEPRAKTEAPVAAPAEEPAPVTEAQPRPRPNISLAAQSPARPPLPTPARHVSAAAAKPKDANDDLF